MPACAFLVRYLPLLMPNTYSTVFLVGPRGAGKTSVGRFLARRLACGFYDTDVLVCGEAGRSIAEIVATEGWEGFRSRESQALALAAKDACVVATGGGMVLDEANRSLMRSRGVVFFLAAPPQVLHERLSRKADDAQRPPLTGMDLMREIESILAEREPLYRETAHHSLDASAPLPKVVASIMRILHRRKGKEL